MLRSKSRPELYFALNIGVSTSADYELWISNFNFFIEEMRNKENDLSVPSAECE